MQTLTELATQMIRWEMVVLPKGAHRIHRMALIKETGIDGYSECTYSEWFVDDLISVKCALGIVGGVWCGMVAVGPPQVVIAMRLE